ncbi:hydrogenase expression/formation protein HypD [Bradyrhizobium elkanii]
MHSILENPKMRNIGGVAIDGFVGPAHVSTIIGTQPYEPLVEQFGKPIVIAGFEPLDVMQAILMLVRQVNEGRYEVENQYSRAVTRQGNRRAKDEVSQVFELREQFEWRGLGLVPNSGLKLKRAYAGFDAEARFAMHELRVADNPACECCAILRGAKRPVDCKLFGTVCTPETPVGSCMVSSEGACAAYWTYGRVRDDQVRRLS